MVASKDEKKTKIIRVAIETIRKHGIDKTTLEDIANAAGMATTSMYYYFPNKNELLRAALSMLWETGFEGVETVAASPVAPEEKLRSIWQAAFMALKQSGVLINIDRRARYQLVEIVGEFVDDFSRKYQEVVKKVLIEGKTQGVFAVDDAEMAANVLSSGIWGIILSAIEHGRVEITEAWVDELAGLLMHGLKIR